MRIMKTGGRGLAMAMLGVLTAQGCGGDGGGGGGEAAGAVPLSPATIRASVNSFVMQGDDSSWARSISADGRYVAFVSSATNLVPGDTNGCEDVFVRDLAAGTTTRASVSSPGEQGNDRSIDPSISSDGRCVAFHSHATNLATGDANGFRDVFVRDLVAGTTQLVSADALGAPGNAGSFQPSISADGRYVAFASDASNLVPGDTNAAVDVFVRDTVEGTAVRVSVGFAGGQGDGSSADPSISADGRYVAFYSLATTLVAGDTNASLDVFVRDTVAGTTVRASVDPLGAQGNFHSYGPSISGDGRYVAFESSATNLEGGDTNDNLDVFVRDTVAGTTVRASVDSLGSQGSLNSRAPTISGDGRYVAFASYATDLVTGDTNGWSDVFVRDTVSATTARISVDSLGAEADGTSGSPSMAFDGRYVAFDSLAGNLVAGDTNGTQDVFVRDLVEETTVRASVESAGAQGNDYSSLPSISSDGRYVAFESYATNLVAGDFNYTSDIFVRDTVAGMTARVSVDSLGAEGNASSSYPSISSDGRYVAFVSYASNLVSGDTNGDSDVFVRDTVEGTTMLISVGSMGAPANSYSASPSVSADGRTVAFTSNASNLVPGDTNGKLDIFVRDTVAGTTVRVSSDSAGAQADSHSYTPSISADGRYVAFSSSAKNLVPGDTNLNDDIFVRDLAAATTTRASVDSAGAQSNGICFSPSVSADGRHVVFASIANNLVAGDTGGTAHVFVRDLVAGTTSLVSVDSLGAPGDSSSSSPTTSSDGRYVAFVSSAANLVAGDTNVASDIFVRDTVAGTTVRISVDSPGAQGDQNSEFPSISSDGRFVVFSSYATTLVAGDSNETSDIFVRGPLP